MATTESRMYRGYKITVSIQPTSDGKCVCKTKISPQSPETVAHSSLGNVGIDRFYIAEPGAVDDSFRRAEASIDRRITGDIGEVDPSFMNALLKLSRNPGVSIDPSALAWMINRVGPFARPQTLIQDGAIGGFVITPTGLHWLSITKWGVNMANNFYIEIDEYFVTCGAEPLPDGKWEASAMFERKKHRSKTLVPANRHRITNTTFDGADDALQAANQLAVQLVRDDQVGLE